MKLYARRGSKAKVKGIREMVQGEKGVSSYPPIPTFPAGPPGFAVQPTVVVLTLIVNCSFFWGERQNI